MEVGLGCDFVLRLLGNGYELLVLETVGVWGGLGGSDLGFLVVEVALVSIGEHEVDTASVLSVDYGDFGKCGDSVAVCELQEVGSDNVGLFYGQKGVLDVEDYFWVE